MARFYAGNPPSASAGWKSGGSIWCEEDTKNWGVYLKTTDPDLRYYNVKLVVADGPAKNKGNYWLSWDTQKHRFTASPHHALLKTHRPDMYDRAVKHMSHMPAKLMPALFINPSSDNIA